MLQNPMNDHLALGRPAVGAGAGYLGGRLLWGDRVLVNALHGVEGIFRQARQAHLQIAGTTGDLYVGEYVSCCAPAQPTHTMIWLALTAAHARGGDISAAHPHAALQGKLPCCHAFRYMQTASQLWTAMPQDHCICSTHGHVGQLRDLQRVRQREADHGGGATLLHSQSGGRKGRQRAQRLQPDAQPPAQGAGPWLHHKLCPERFS